MHTDADGATAPRWKVVGGNSFFTNSARQRQTQQEFIHVPHANEQVHAVVDPCATHRRRKVVDWLGRNGRGIFHFTDHRAVGVAARRFPANVDWL